MMFCLRFDFELRTFQQNHVLETKEFRWHSCLTHDQSFFSIGTLILIEEFVIYEPQFPIIDSEEEEKVLLHSEIKNNYFLFGASFRYEFPAIFCFADSIESKEIKE